MKMKIEKNIDKTETMFLIPENRKEFRTLNRIWRDSPRFEKRGCCIHASAITQHGIENSDFTIQIYQKIASKDVYKEINEE